VILKRKLVNDRDCISVELVRERGAKGAENHFLGEMEGVRAGGWTVSNAAVAPDRVAAASYPCPTRALLPPGLLAATADLRAILGGVRSLSETVQIVLHSGEQEALIDLSGKDTLTQFDLADYLVVQILNL